MVDGEEEFLRYLQSIADSVDFEKWFFGHYHEDIEIEDTFVGLIDEIIRF